MSVINKNNIEDSIINQFQISTEQLSSAVKHLNKDVSFWDTFNNSYNGVKGKALKIAEYTAFLFSSLTVVGFFAWTAFKYQKVSEANKARKAIRNPVDFTKQVSDLSGLGISPKEAQTGKINIDLKKYLENNGLEKTNKDQKNITSLLNDHNEKTLPYLSKAINEVFKTLPKESQTGEMHRALYGAFITQAIKTKTFSSLSIDSKKSPINGLHNINYLNALSPQEWAFESGIAMCSKDNPQFVGQNIARTLEFPALNDPDKTIQERIDILQKAIKNLESCEKEIRSQIRTNGYIFKGANHSNGIKEGFIKESSDQIKSQIDSSLERINNARDINKLKKDFLNALKADVRKISDESHIESEENLTFAIQYTHMSEDEKSNHAKAKDLDKNNLNKACELVISNKDSTIKKLNEIKKSLNNLSKEFQSFIEKNEELAKQEIAYISKLKEYQATTSNTNSLSFSDKINIDLDENKIELEMNDCIDLLKVSAGSKESSGSPMLTASILYHLLDAEFQEDFFTRLDLPWRTEIFYDALDDEKELEIMNQKDKVLKNQNKIIMKKIESTKTQLKTLEEAEKLERIALFVLDREEDETSLKEAGLTKKFACSEEGSPLHKLREALEKFEYKAISTEGSTQADSENGGKQ